MKLIVEIGDTSKDNRFAPWTICRIQPLCAADGISAHSKTDQTEKLARLIDLSKWVEDAVNAFYEKATTSSQSASTNSSGEPLTR